MIQIQTDSMGQPYIEWPQVVNAKPDGFKRAWIQTKTGEKDWARCGRYLNVVRIDKTRAGISGNPTDFPIYSNLSDAQILEAFVASVCAITGCALP